MLPIPISPRTKRSQSISRTVLPPISHASSKRSGDMAASYRMSFVGLPTPTSTAVTVAPATSARAFIVETPDWKASIIEAVTSVGYALTPAEATP